MDKQEQREERRLIHKLKETQAGQAGREADRRQQGDMTETEIVRRARKPKGLTRRNDLR